MLKSLLVHISASDLYPSVSDVPQTGLQALGGNREHLNRKESLRREASRLFGKRVGGRT